GIHASPTAVMIYDNAVGYLVGEENRGLETMFIMMNAARFGVGLEGVAIAERAFQRAAAGPRPRRGRQDGADHPPSRRAPHADADEVADRGDARPVLNGGRGA